MFVYYLKQNHSVSYYDEVGYLNVSKNILNQGLFNLVEPLRTYFYPLILSILSIFSDGNTENIKILMSILQFLVYTYTVFMIAEKSFVFSSSKLGYYSIVCFGLLNPYLIQATTLLLTDILASCCVILSIIRLVFGDFHKISTYFVVIILTYIAVMIRPAFLIVVPVIIVLLVVRKLLLKDVSVIKSIGILILSLFIFFPQLHNNVKQFDNWTPLVNDNLYKLQSNLATKNLKYGTVIISNENPALFSISPFAVDQSVNGMFDMIYKQFPKFAVVYSAHLFGVLDWGYIDTYITNYYPVSRMIASVFLYIYWMISFIGLYKMIRMKKNKQQLFFLISLGTSFLLYWAFIGTAIVESRFGYVLFLLLLPFAGWGIVNIYSNLKNSTNKFNYKKCIQYVLISIVIVMLTLYISFLIDYQTGRINWLGL